MITHLSLCLTDIASSGKQVEQDRLSGADSEHRQPAKIRNAVAQKRKRDKKCRSKFWEAFRQADMDHNIINFILQRNREVESELRLKTESKLLADAKVQHFIELKSKELEDFIHARKFDGTAFKKGLISGTDGKLNKLHYRDKLLSL